MQLIKKLMAIGLILFLSGCATPRQQIQVKRTSGDFDYRTRIYKNYDHNLQLVIPKYWTVYSGDTLYRLPLVKETESLGWEILVVGEMGDEKAFYLVSIPWSDSVESLLRQQDSSSSNPPIGSTLTVKEIRFREIKMLERSAQLKSSKTFFKERAFVNKQFAYRLQIFNTFSLVSERDAEILENLSFQLEDKESSPLEKKLQLPEKPQTSIPITQPPGPNIVTVTGTSANVRSGAGNDFSIVTTVKQGDKLILLGEYGEWSNVRLENGMEGWINSRFVK